MNIITESERLYIRKLVPNDIESFYRLESDPRVIKFIPNNKTLSYNECKKVLYKYIKNYKTNKLGTWAIVLQDTNELIGVTQLKYSRKIKKVEIGTKIMPEYWGYGYASELSSILIDYGLYKLNIDEIFAITNIGNVGAIKSLENIGMEFLKYGYYNGAEVVYYSIKKKNEGRT